MESEYQWDFKSRLQVSWHLSGLGLAVLGVVGGRRSLDRLQGLLPGQGSPPTHAFPTVLRVLGVGATLVAELVGSADAFA